MTTSGIEPATCRFVAQCLNHYATAYLLNLNLRPLVSCCAEIPFDWDITLPQWVIESRPFEKPLEIRLNTLSPKVGNRLRSDPEARPRRTETSESLVRCLPMLHHTCLWLLHQNLSQNKFCGEFRTSKSKFLLLIKARKIYVFNAFTAVHNTDGLDCTIQIVLKKFLVFPMRIFMKLANIQQHQVQTTYKYYFYFVDFHKIHN